MENTHLITIIATALVSILSAIGLPQMYKHLTEKKQIETDSACQEKIKLLEMRIAQITTSVDMMLTIIESEFDDTSAYHTVILKVKALLTNAPDGNQ